MFGNSNSSNSLLQSINGAELTIGQGITVKGRSGSLGYNPEVGGATTAAVINQGVIEIAQDATILIPKGLISNSGTISNHSPTVITIANASLTNDASFLATSPGSTIVVNGDITGNTKASSLHINSGTVQIRGGTPSSPRQLEAMSLDRGISGATSHSNFYYATLALAPNTHVQLVDHADNSDGATPEVVYANALIIPLGSSLDLGGRTLYTRSVRIDGTVTGGAVVQVPDGGTIERNVSIAGAISTAGELDEWTFYSRSNRDITILLRGYPKSKITQ